MNCSSLEGLLANRSTAVAAFRMAGQLQRKGK